MVATAKDFIRLTTTVVFIVLFGCLQQPAKATPVPSPTPVPAPTPLPSLTPAEWTGEHYIVYWAKAPFRVPPSPTPPLKTTPTPVPTPIPPTVFGQKCSNDADCPSGYFCNSFSRSYFTYDANGSASQVTESYGDKLCYLACSNDADCEKGEYCGSITKNVRGQPAESMVCAQK